MQLTQDERRVKSQIRRFSSQGGAVIRFVVAWWDRLAPPFVACAVLASITVLATGCALSSQEEIGVVQQAGINPNGINPNGINPNGINPNGINPNGLQG